MATNKRKVMLPHTMEKSGVDLIRSRDDIEMVIYPAGISQADLLPQLADCAGIALSGTPYKKTEMDASPAMQVVGAHRAVAGRARAAHRRLGGRVDGIGGAVGRAGGCGHAVRRSAVVRTGHSGRQQRRINP